MTVLRWLLQTTAVALIALHAWVLWQRVAEGAMADGQVAVRWLGTAALLVIAGWLHRQGVSLVRGRQAGVFWLAVLLLHAGLPAPLTAAGVVLHHLPPAFVVLLALPVGLGWLGEWLSLDAAPSGSQAFRRQRRLRLLPAAALALYPPIRRRPPPF